MRQYLVEGVTGAFPFIVDRAKAPVTESRPNGGSYTRIPGRFSVCDCVNGNNRRYAKRVWEKNLQTGSVLKESIGRNAAFGLLEHPKDGIVSLLSPISHHVTNAEMIESRDPATGKLVYEVVGEIALLDTDEGRKLKALIEGGYNPLVSSRGYGSLAKAPDGVDEVQEDYVCEGWDVVIKPSFENAELTPDRSATTARMAEPYKPDPQAESSASSKAAPQATAANPVITLKESSPSSGSVAPAPTSENKSQTKTMELNEIKSRISTLRGAKPAQFAESLTQIEELHQEVASWAASDPKRSWDAQKAHKSLDEIASSFNETLRQPVKESRRLTEQNVKLMRVVDAVAKTAVTYKKRLGESVKNDGSRVKMIEELTRRGQGWQRVAESRKAKFATMEKDFDTACEALDLMAQRYHEDITELGRRLIVLEFKDRAQTPEIQKQLKEATRLRHIVGIRETLEGKKPEKAVNEEGKGGDPGGKQPKEGEQPSKEGIKDEKQKGAPSPNEGCVAKEPGSVTHESSAKGKKDGVQPVAESAKVLKSERVDISVRNVNESVELVRRLSGAAPATK